MSVRKDVFNKYVKQGPERWMGRDKMESLVWIAQESARTM